MGSSVVTTVGELGLKPFSKPVQPWDDRYGPGQVRGALNQVAKNFTTHDASPAIHLNRTVTDTVSTTPVQILPPVSSASGHTQYVLYVAGDDGSSNAFLDQIALHGNGTTVAVVSSAATIGAPAARTYALTAGVLTLAMAAGTYTVIVSAIVLDTV